MERSCHHLGFPEFSTIIRRAEFRFQDYVVSSLMTLYVHDYKYYIYLLETELFESESNILWISSVLWSI